MIHEDFKGKSPIGGFVEIRDKNLKN